MSARFSVLVVIIFMAGCTSVQVDPLSSHLQPDMICIEKNDKVIVADFLPVIRDRFEHHGIRTQVNQSPDPRSCPYILTYVAHQTWDMATYMHSAELRLEHDGRKVATAKYHLRNRGGLSLAKWGGVEGKMNPVVDELLGKKI
jgi:hypothetical protein